MNFKKIGTATVYLVGGAVRDALLNVVSKDNDYVVVGATHKMMIEHGFSKVGADFPVYLSPEGEEYALARTERKTGNGYAGFDTNSSSSVTLEDDLFRRDLTINSMAMKEDGTVIDPCGGRFDLQNRVLRHTSDAFREDPVRILRVARFAARYGFTVHADTLDMVSNMVATGEMNHLVPERVWTEISRGLMEKDPRRMFSVLASVGALAAIPVYKKGAIATDLFHYLLHSNVEVPLVVRAAFVLDLNNSTYTRFSEKIPYEVSRLASAFDEAIPELQRYHMISASRRLMLFNMIGIIGSMRTSDLYQQIMQCYDIWAFSRRHLNLPNIKAHIEESRQRILNIDMIDLLKDVSPEHVKQTIYNKHIHMLGL
jgi:tRNA nucleotidyltransferase/poly(A) polymerase